MNQTSTDQQFHSPRISESWHLRNNSRGVSGALGPDYFSPSPNYRSSASAPIMTLQKRLLLSSKKKEDEIKTRIPVKECYCNRLTRKMQFRSIRTKVKPAPCSHCRSLIDLRPMAWVESNDIQSTNRTPLSCETLRRIRKVNYSPRSQFLQNKLCSTHNLLDEKLTEVSSTSDSRHLSRYPSSAGHRVQETFKPLRSSCRNIPSEFLHEFNDCSHSNQEIIIPSKKPSREMLPKRTISSKKASTTKDEKTRSGNFTSEGRSQSNQTRVSRQNHEEYHGEDYFGEYDITPRTSKQTGQVSKLRNRREAIQDEDNEMIDLHKFREQNYFDTHGSTQTLLSSRSSGSLERYLLNERLFPQPAGKIHRGDLVVTMPPCATKQRKRIHYFPRYVVKQEKNYGTEKQKNGRGCPLTGHAIDVRSLKIQHPTNSLALRFQKGVP